MGLARLFGILSIRTALFVADERQPHYPKDEAGRVFAHTKMPIRYFDNLPAGKVVARITNDTEAVRDLYVTVLSTFVTSGIYMLGIFTALFLLDVKLAFVCLAIVPIIWLWSVIYRKYASYYNQKSVRSTVTLTQNE